MDISVLGDFAFAIKNTRVMLAEARVQKIAETGERISGSAKTDINMGLPVKDGDPVAVRIFLETVIVTDKDKEPCMVAKLTYLGLFGYEGSADAVRSAIEQSEYIGYVLAAQIYPLATQAWMRLVHSMGANITGPVPLGLKIDKRNLATSAAIGGKSRSAQGVTAEKKAAARRKRTKTT